MRLLRWLPSSRHGASRGIGGTPDALSGGRGQHCRTMPTLGPSRSATCHTRKPSLHAPFTAMSASAADASAFPAATVQPATERPPRPAATIVVVRDGEAGIE